MPHCDFVDQAVEVSASASSVAANDQAAELGGWATDWESVRGDLLSVQEKRQRLRVERKRDMIPTVEQSCSIDQRVKRAPGCRSRCSFRSRSRFECMSEELQVDLFAIR